MISSGLIKIAALAAGLQPMVQPVEVIGDDLQLILPADTPIRLTTVTTLDSRTAVQGSRFALTVADDIIVESHILIAQGTPAVGEIEAVNGKGMFGQAGLLVLRPLFIEVSGRRINLIGMTNLRGKDATATAAVTTAITPFGLFITGKSATVPAGSVVFGRVRSNVTFPAVKPPVPNPAPVAPAAN